jgi:hypothetical protein
MPLFRRARAKGTQPTSPMLPAPFPRLDGSTWPDRRTAGADGFAAATYYEMARQEAFDPAVHDVTDLVVDHLLPRLDTGAAAGDEDHMRRLCTAAAQLGVGVARVERRVVATGDPAGLHRDIAGVLWLAAGDLPTTDTRQREVARYLLLCGYHLGRHGRESLPELVAALEADDHPAVRRSH